MILVTGSTGFVGRHLVPGLVGAGWPVRIFSPGPAGGGVGRLPWGNLPVEVASGSPYELDDLVSAMRGVHTVFHLASAQWWGRLRDLERVDVGGTDLLIQAARQARIGRLIVMSHLGASPASAYSLYRAKGLVEESVRACGVPYTIVRSGLLFGEQDRFVNNLAMLLRTNPVLFIQPGQGENLLHPLHIHDLAAALVSCVESLEAVDRVLEVGGPEYISFEEMVRTVMRVSGAPRSVVSLPTYNVRFLTRMMGRMFRRWPVTLQWFDILAAHRTTGLNNMSDLFGIRPVRFEETLMQYMPGRRYTVELLQFLFRRRRPRGV